MRSSLPLNIANHICQSHFHFFLSLTNLPIITTAWIIKFLIITFHFIIILLILPFSGASSILFGALDCACFFSFNSRALICYYMFRFIRYHIFFLNLSVYLLSLFSKGCMNNFVYLFTEVSNCDVTNIV